MGRRWPQGSNCGFIISFKTIKVNAVVISGRVVSLPRSSLHAACAVVLSLSYMSH